MSKEVRGGHPLGHHQAGKVEGFDALAELALNLRWSWNHATDEVWRRLEPELWETPGQIEHKQYIQRLGQEKPEIRNWQWGGGEANRPKQIAGVRLPPPL